MARSITYNFVFSSILTVSNYIFPFLVFPYIARVLEVENIGIVNFVDSIINYAILFSSMGITIIGTRNIASAKNNKAKLNEIFTSLFVLTAIFTLLSSGILITLTYSLDAFVPYRKMLLIGLIKLWGNFFLIDWLYKGLEDFRYITVRTILVKMVYVVAVFIFIRTESDYITYFLLLCLMVAVNAAFNCYRATKLVEFRFRIRSLRTYFGPFCILGFYLFLNSMYTTFNVTYLGFACGDTQVGFYTTATKLFNIILALYTAYTTVALPRASALLARGQKDEFEHLIEMSTHGLMMFAIPAAIFFMIFSKGAIALIAGADYGGAIVPMTIVMPLLFIIGYEQIIVVQVLTPMAKDKIILTNAIIGATIGILGNIFLVNRFQAIGSSIVWFAAEVAVLISAQYFVNKHTSIRFPWRSLLKNLIAYLPYIAIGLLISKGLPIGPMAALIIGGGFALVYFLTIQCLWLKNPVFIATLQKFNLPLPSIALK